MTRTLTQRHLVFLEKELGISDVDALDDASFDAAYEKLCTIEEVEFANAEESERGDLAADIVTYMAQQFSTVEG